MALNPRIWYPIAVVGCVVNLVLIGVPMTPMEPWHPALHAAVAVGFGMWAQRLRARRREGAADTGEVSQANDAEVAALRDEVVELRREVGELQERMDFTERILSQAREKEQLPLRKPDG